MKDYGVMNEEKPSQPRMNENLSISSAERIEPETDRTSIIIYIKLTDSDIRTISINPDVETVGSLKSNVIF